MAATIRISESPPTTYPTIPDLPPDVSAAAVWQRIEAWIGWRWGVRAVVFTVEGPGDWNAPLQPATFGVKEIWRDDAWAAVTLQPTATEGLFLPECAQYRIAATVGDAAAPPAAVLDAASRLARYFCETCDPSRALLAKESIEGIASFEYAGGPGASGRSLQYSGAADLLRPWRNLGAA